MAGRFAPSPTGDLHLGNLRTALAAWLSARAGGRGFLIRMEDLDIVQASVDHERRQLADLAALGIDHDREVIRQSERFDRYHDAIARLDRDGLVYPCWCTRREIAAAAAAPHGTSPVAARSTIDGPPTIDVAPGAYPGTCQTLTERDRRARIDSGRRPARRLRADGAVLAWRDAVHGSRRGAVDDFVLERGDGVPSYHVAVVVDDHDQGVTEAVRGDDLLSTTARHVHLQQLLGLDTPAYAHVPLVLGADGERLAKRHGAVTLADLAAGGVGPREVLRALAGSLGATGAALDHVATAADLLDIDWDHVDRRTVDGHTVDRRFDIAAVPRHPIMADHLSFERSPGF